MAKSTDLKFLKSLKKGDKVYITNNRWVNGLCIVMEEYSIGMVKVREYKATLPYYYPLDSNPKGRIVLWTKKRQK